MTQKLSHRLLCLMFICILVLSALSGCAGSPTQQKAQALTRGIVNYYLELNGLA